MKQLALILIFCCLTLSIFGQKSKFSLGLTGSYDFNLTPNSTIGSVIFDIMDIEHQNGFSAGISVQYELSNRLKLLSGATLGCRVYQGNYNNFFSLVPFDAAIPQSIKDRARFIQVPLMIGVRVLDSEKFNFVPAVGAEFDFFIHETYSSIMQDGSEQEVNYFAPVYNTFQLLLRFDLMLEVPINDRWFLSAGPQFRYGLLKPDEDGFLNNNIILGIAAGMHYKL